jgi:hypothetical protein
MNDNSVVQQLKEQLTLKEQENQQLQAQLQHLRGWMNSLQQRARANDPHALLVARELYVGGVPEGTTEVRRVEGVSRLSCGHCSSIIRPRDRVDIAVRRSGLDLVVPLGSFKLEEAALVSYFAAAAVLPLVAWLAGTAVASGQAVKCSTAGGRQLAMSQPLTSCCTLTLVKLCFVKSWSVQPLLLHFPTHHLHHDDDDDHHLQHVVQYHHAALSCYQSLRGAASTLQLSSQQHLTLLLFAATACRTTCAHSSTH